MKILLFLILSLFSINAFASDLVLDVRMEDNTNSTVVTEQSGYGHTCTAQQNTDQISTSGAPNRGNGFTFNGSSDYINCGNDPSLNITDAITIEAWVKTSIVKSNNYIVDKFEKDVDDSYGLALEPNDIKYFVTGAGPLYHDVIPGGLTTGIWYHVAITYDRVKAKSYWNGQFVDEHLNAAAIPSSDVNVLIGRLGGWNLYFNGAIDEVRIFNYALDAATIQHHYQQGRHHH